MQTVNFEWARVRQSSIMSMTLLEEPLLLSAQEETTERDPTSMILSTNAADEEENSSQENEHPTPQRLPYTAMLANFSTSYNVVNISLVLPILQILYNKDNTADDDAIVASSLLGGMMVGQVLGGAAGDWRALGPLGALRLVVMLQVVASLASAFLIPLPSSTTNNVYMWLAVWRFWLGVGAGGVYPLAAVLSATTGDDNTRESNHKSLHRVVLTFAVQGVGFWTVPATALVLLYTFPLQIVWRLLLGLGSLPGLLLLWWQWREAKTDRFVISQLEEDPVAEQSAIEAQAEPENSRTEGRLPDDHLSLQGVPRPQPQDRDDSDFVDSDGETGTILDSQDGIFQEQSESSWWCAVRHEPDLGRKLLGTALTWFLFDILFYGNTLFEPVVLEAAFGRHAQSPSALHELRQTAFEALVLSSIALPGYAVAARWLGNTACGIEQTPRHVMRQGFLVMAALYLMIGLFWKELKQVPAVLLILYGLSFFFANYGPNTTTFVLPSLMYTPACRSTWNGLSAAAGKLGAWTGASLFEPTAAACGDATVMLICAGVAVVAFGLTQAFVRTRTTSFESSR